MGDMMAESGVDHPLTELDMIEIGHAFLRLKTAAERANKALTSLLKDEDLDLYAKAQVRSAMLCLREAME